MLNLETLAPYLPYKLRLSVQKDYSIGDGFWVLKGNETELTAELLRPQMLFCKPILRPLSDLVVEIEIDGNKFTPIESLFGLSYSEWDGESESVPACVAHTYNCSKGKVFPKFLPYWVTNQLVKWHFDIFELIENGYAISIHDAQS